jgi:hypothetical protein
MPRGAGIKATLIGTGTAMNGLKILGIAAIMFAVVPGSALPQTSEQPDPRIADLVQAGKLRNSGWHQDMGGDVPHTVMSGTMFIEFPVRRKGWRACPS